MPPARPLWRGAAWLKAIAMMMREGQATAIRRLDYAAPPYWIDTVDLTFDLDPAKTRVLNRMRLRRNPDVPAQPLRLDGEELNLARVQVNGAGSSFKIEDGQLVLENLPEGPEPFELEIFTTCQPAKNTQLSGLYVSQGTFFTQCEAEGFRRITYFLDRPDVMATFSVLLRAPRADYPVLLSNGNLVEHGELEDGRHFARWVDPHKKPSYLFALVAGKLVAREQKITSRGGQEHLLQIYVRAGDLGKTEHAMNSLMASIAWDEARFNLPLDLERFMIVATSDFNMGAMENKGLNVFNTKYVLASQATATDVDFANIESVVGHEYFHNWTGNRVTCRDWFQLSLKEGLTVFRDQEFSMDMAGSPSARAVKRIEDVRVLRTVQFPEDAGPMAHPVRPDSYVEINNFYTVTIYEKGAEVVRMQHNLVGRDGFARGMKLYFERHDGQAVTCDDFAAAMADANPGSELSNRLEQFKRWYSQAGTPRLAVSESYDAAAKTYSLTFRQSCPPTPDKMEKLPFVIPVALGLLDGNGADLPLRLAGEAAAAGTSRVLSVTQAEQTFTFVDIAEQPLPSLLRGFSAPVKLSFPYSRDQLMFLMQHDSDGFNRWDAGQQLSVQVLQELIGQHQAGQPLQLDQRLIDALRTVLMDETLDQAMVAEMLSLPSEAYLTEISEVADVDAIHAAREFARKLLADHVFETLWLRYQANRELSRQTPYVASAEHFARRALQNIALSYLMLSGKSEVLAATLEQFEACDNMTERLTALAVLVNSPFEAEKAQALAVFAENFKDNPLVMDQWFSVQAGSTQPGGLARVKALMEHPAFTLKNPNKVRALIGAFAGQNLINFHAADGSGYRFLADLVIQLNGFNPQIASRQLAPLTRWRKYDSARQALMKAELERILASGGLSSDVFEVVSKSLA